MAHYCFQLFLQTPEKHPTDGKSILSPGSQKQKSRIANMITSNIKEYHLTQEGQVELSALAMKNLGILDKSIFLSQDVN